MAVNKYDLSPKADNDLEHIIDWYEHLSSGIGILFLNELEQSLIEIIRNPYACKLVCVDIRRYIMKQFPYIIYYTIDSGEVKLLRVRGKRQKPLKRYT